jgi:GNAT superfamily N-acetyltransferase
VLYARAGKLTTGELADRFSYYWPTPTRRLRLQSINTRCPWTPRSRPVMWTDPARRGQGIGSALLREIIAFARAGEVGRLRLHALPTGRKLYERFGFLERTGGRVLTL